MKWHGNVNVGPAMSWPLACAMERLQASGLRKVHVGRLISAACRLVPLAACRSKSMRAKVRVEMLLKWTDTDYLSIPLSPGRVWAFGARIVHDGGVHDS
jgi:hypothetical protein